MSRSAARGDVRGPDVGLRGEVPPQVPQPPEEGAHRGGRRPARRVVRHYSSEEEDALHRALGAAFEEHNMEHYPAPTYSPDMNCIENLFGIAEHKTGRQHAANPPQSMDDSIERFKKACKACATQGTIKGLQESTPTRWEDLIANQGGPTRW